MSLKDSLVIILYVYAYTFSLYSYTLLMKIVHNHYIGVNSIVGFLKNYNLEILHINGNSIGDNGMSVMMNGLQQNKTLVQLHVKECEFSAKGTLHSTYVHNAGACLG